MATTVRLPEELEKQLTKMAKLTGRKKSSFIIEALREHLGDMADYLEAAERMRNYDETKSISLEEMSRAYGLED